MFIKKIIISNYKCYYGDFELELTDGVNIIVGDNEAGKSTILEAIHLALSGLVNGRYVKNEINQNIFNNQVVDEYLSSLATPDPQKLPEVLIEVYLSTDTLPEYLGTNNSQRIKETGFSVKISFDERFDKEYEKLIEFGDIHSLPIEYYEVTWMNFARDQITPRTIPIKSSFIDSANTKYVNGSDVYISRIIKESLEIEEEIKIAQAYRKMKDVFREDASVTAINKEIDSAAKISNKKVEISVDFESKNAWENSLVTCIDNVPFDYIGKGEQCIIKTNLSLSNKRTDKTSIILIEEPENHLSYSNLYRLLDSINQQIGSKQVIITTHSSFVLNKLGLDKILLLSDKQVIRFSDLSEETYTFFMKLSGYDTLRFILSDKVILVEGDSDDLVLQKAYMDTHEGKLPIFERIDIMTVGLAFLRFLEIAEKIGRRVVVVTDNDGDVKQLEKKYAKYLGKNAKENITICYDHEVDSGGLLIGEKPYNYNTLEPKFVKANGLEIVNDVLGTEYDNVDDLYRYMKSNKTECALRVFEYQKTIKYPQYILDAIAEK